MLNPKNSASEPPAKLTHKARLFFAFSSFRNIIIKKSNGLAGGASKKNQTNNANIQSDQAMLSVFFNILQKFRHFINAVNQQFFWLI